MTPDRGVKSALGRLVREAGKSPRGTTTLEGEEGLSAVLEDSEVGQARLIQVFREGRKVYWSFVVHKDEEEPQFFPQEVPYISSAYCMLSWHEKTGLCAIWTPGSGEEAESYIAEFAAKLEALEMPEGVGELMENVRSVGRQATAGLKEGLEAVLPPSLFGKLVKVADEILPKEIPGEARKIADTVSAFLEDHGWAPTGDPEISRISLSRVFERDGSQQELKVFSMPLVSTVGLWEKRPS